MACKHVSPTLRGDHDLDVNVQTVNGCDAMVLKYHCKPLQIRQFGILSHVQAWPQSTFSRHTIGAIWSVALKQHSSSGPRAYVVSWQHWAGELGMGC